MATYYWVGGSGNWDATSTANWSNASGGSSGFGPPTSADNVIFDAGSNVGTGAFTVTITGTSAAPAVCADFSTGGAGGALDGAMTLAFGSAGVLYCYGSMTLPATNLSVTGSGTSDLVFASTSTGKTLTTNGVTLAQVTTTRFIGIGGAWTLGSALTANSVFVLAGTFDTGNYNLTINSIQRNANTGTTTITLGSSTINCSGSAPINFSVTTGFTFNANTSTITCSNTSPTFTGGGLTFYNVTFSSTASGTVAISGANTFNNLTQTSRSATGIRIVSIGANQTVSGTLTIGAANTAIRRIRVASDTVGTQRTITLNGSLATLADVDFDSIVAAGTAGTWTGTRLGNGLNNSGITFDAPKTVYWNLAGSQNWSATGWATTNNGTPNVNNFPLAQDTATFTEAGAAGTVTFDNNWMVGSIQMADGVSNRTTAFTLATSTSSPRFYGNITLFSNLTLSGTASLAFRGIGVTQTITSAGISFTQPIDINITTGTFRLADNFTNTSTTALAFASGTIDLNNNTLTCVAFSSSNSNTRSIAFGTGNITLTGNGGTIWSLATATNFSVTGTPIINSTYSGSTGTRNFIAGALSESNSISLNVTAGTDIFQFQSTNGGLKNVSFSGFAGSFTLAADTKIYGNLILSSGMTVNSSNLQITFSATSGTQQITSNGKTLDFTTVVNAPGATVQLQDNLTIGSTRTFTLTAGTLDLTGNSGNWTLSTGLFNSSNSNTRAIAFGTGNITVTGNNASVWNSITATNFTYTGTSTVNATYSGSTGTRIIGHGSTAGGSESNAINFNISAGTDSVTINGGTSSAYKNLIFTGFSGTLTASASLGRRIYGNFTLSSGMTMPSSDAGFVFQATSGTQQITTSGQTLDSNVTINAPGATVSLVDALTLGSTRTLTLTAGTFTANNQNCTTGAFSSSNTNIRTLTMGSGTWALSGSGAVWNVTDPTNLTFNKNTANITLSDTSTSARTFAGGGLTYNNLTIGGTTGTSTLTVTGANTFGTIASSKTVAHTIIIPAASTTTVSDWTASGSAGNVLTLNSSSSGSAATLTKTGGGTISGISYLNIKDITATPTGIWYAGVGSVNSGNNSGWVFNNGNFLIFF